MLTVKIRPVTYRGRSFELFVENTENEQFFVQGDWRTAREAAQVAATHLNDWYTLPQRDLPAILKVLL